MVAIALSKNVVARVSILVYAERDHLVRCSPKCNSLNIDTQPKNTFCLRRGSNRNFTWIGRFLIIFDINNALNATFFCSALRLTVNKSELHYVREARLIESADISLTFYMDARW